MSNIEDVKHIINFLRDNEIETGHKKGVKPLENMLRELEQQKEKNKKLNLENQALYESINCNDDNMLARRYEKLQKENKGLKEKLDFNERSAIFYQNKYFEFKKELEKAKKQLDLDYVDNNYVSKDKIKAEIKELEYNLNKMEKQEQFKVKIYSPIDIIKAQILELVEILEGE